MSGQHNRPQLLVKDFITGRLCGAATRHARRAIQIESANPYRPRVPAAYAVGEHLEVMELAASAVIMSIAAAEGIVNELFTEAVEASKMATRKPRVGTIGIAAEERWVKMWEQGIPGRGYNVIAKCQIALELADRDPLPADRGTAQQMNALVALRNALVHSTPTFLPHGIDLPISARGSLEKQLSGKFAASTMIPKTEPFIWRRCLSAGCAKWAVDTRSAFTNDFYAALGIERRGEVIW